MTSDLNVKIGSEITGYEKIMSKHRFGIRDEHGEYFTNFCTVNQYVKGGSLLPYKGIHKTMWVSADHKTKHKIDYIWINKKLKSPQDDIKV